jgi:hypothetical protein
VKNVEGENSSLEKEFEEELKKLFEEFGIEGVEINHNENVQEE